LKRRRVDDHELVFAFQPLEQLAEDGALQQFRRALRAAAGAEEGKILADLDDAEAGMIREIAFE
jgi:hypothetical protein